MRASEPKYFYRRVLQGLSYGAPGGCPQVKTAPRGEGGGYQHLPAVAVDSARHKKPRVGAKAALQVRRSRCRIRGGGMLGSLLRRSGSCGGRRSSLPALWKSGPSVAVSRAAYFDPPKNVWGGQSIRRMRAQPHLGRTAWGQWSGATAAACAAAAAVVATGLDLGSGSTAAFAEAEQPPSATASAQAPQPDPIAGGDSTLPDPDDEKSIEEALNCPCIDGMKEGPCGEVFVSAYRCFLESKAEERGSDCLDQFQGMQACFVEHADYYTKDDGEEEKTNDEGPEPPAKKPKSPKKPSQWDYL
jgi:intermembrane space import and assembly protein 40